MALSACPQFGIPMENGTEKEGEYAAARKDTEVATFGGGCFWCTEAIFSGVKGVKSAVSGYAGGDVANPSYELVCTDTTGHAEVVQIEFDPSAVSYRELLEIFFSTHDPTTKDQQGADYGRQYRSIILYHSEEQKREARETLDRLTEEHVFDDPIVTEIVPFRSFYKAEEYHQKYFAKNPGKPYCRIVISPKLAKFRKLLSQRAASPD